MMQAASTLPRPRCFTPGTAARPPWGTAVGASWPARCGIGAARRDNDGAGSDQSIPITTTTTITITITTTIGDSNTVDIVFIRALRIETVIGIYDWERDIRQAVVLDIDMAVDIRPAAADDDITQALDYKAVSKRLKQFVGESRFQLVETLAERCATLIREEFGVPWLRLTLDKAGAVSGAEGVGVVIERGERPQS